ncbi:group II truncated hemoglobin [Bacteriovorax sp. Seq25_V]|uniref:group II truncated hemoglobin n=1 Tax=Bacteriovorax sp. Seq25_V TaxID=1201288 RepID=UPI000389E362|nr:group II truncated hemoglobin [Bacteriovorax sp. Seq25_V]EQC43691.1 globin, protozoan/cyanobacterial family [Bacteriovorax sp. Seq25_V]
MELLNKIKSMLSKETKPILPYDQIGGEEVLQKLVDRFYFHMDTNLQAKECRDLHAKSLESANKKLFMFLSGWLGGPSLYIEAYGHPMMRRRHFPFKIGPKERDQWLLCMRLSLSELNLEAKLDSQLWEGFRKFAEHMRNHED